MLLFNEETAFFAPAIMEPEVGNEGNEIGINRIIYNILMTYSGRYRVQNNLKYDGDPSKVFYRSLWERQAFKWLDENPQVKKWSSEEVVVPYRCKTDGKLHRYFVDLKIIFDTGKTYLIEIKPEKQTITPTKKKIVSPKYIKEVMGYVKNTSKWEAAEEYCKDRGWIFEIWTEKTLKGLGIKILTG